MTLNTTKEPVVNYPLTLTILTPVCVKSHDEPLSPLADYVQDGDRIHYIDQQKFLKLLSTLKISDSYANMVLQVDVQQQDKHDEFKQFLEENNIQISDISSVSRPYSIQSNLAQISRHIHSAGRVYIPGSTLKGMARNALFFSFYNDPKMKSELIRKSNEKENPSNYDSIRRIKEGEDFFVAKNKGFLYNNASFWGFEDSAPVDSDKISIIQLDRKRLIRKEKEKDIETLSVLQEVILPGTTIPLNLFYKISTLDKTIKGKIENYYNRQTTNPEILFKSINQFSKSFLEYQKSFIEHDDTKRYSSQINSLLRLVVKFLENNQMALCCVGFGKSRLQNTLGLSVTQNWDRLRITTPTTFFTEANTGETIGWCVIGTEAYIQAEEQICGMAIEEQLNIPIANYQLSEIKDCHLGDEVIVQVKSIKSKKPKVLIAEVLFKGEISEIEIIGLEHLHFQNGDWLKVLLKDKSQKGEFKQAKFKKTI